MMPASPEASGFSRKTIGLDRRHARGTSTMAARRRAGDFPSRDHRLLVLVRTELAHMPPGVDAYACRCAATEASTGRRTAIVRQTSRATSRHS